LYVTVLVVAIMPEDIEENEPPTCIPSAQKGFQTTGSIAQSNQCCERAIKVLQSPE
jgi:hypothetical protein